MALFQVVILFLGILILFVKISSSQEILDINILLDKFMQFTANELHVEEIQVRSISLFTFL